MPDIEENKTEVNSDSTAENNTSDVVEGVSDTVASDSVSATAEETTEETGTASTDNSKNVVAEKIEGINLPQSIVLNSLADFISELKEIGYDVEVKIYPTK